ncbi:target of Nesh-SH3-like isoform X1 [Poecilia latipinna]|uniref:target of Nesh-SH3-like isoform X1 n=1 Tax=Poecilia latipinna TaxID=48699 RepID=UPI00072DEF2C|nr:PREDICTED: target of Nesh-SH3-like isoform X1 [Poecilia latipinna]
MPWQNSHCFLLLFLTAFLIGTALSLPSTSHRRRVRRQNMKVRISASGDTIVMKFLHPNTDTKLEGYILGYGSSMFSKQFIQLPENGQPYETEFDAEPKYLVAVQPIPANEVKKQCKGKVELQKPLHLVIGSVTPTSVLLSWGMLLKTPFEGNVMNDCLEDGHYTVRYREKNRKWNYQTCPTSDTVIDNLKPHAVYEFGVQPNSKDGAGAWSKPVLHNVSTAGIQEKVIRRILKYPISPVKTFTPAPPSFQFPLQHASKNRTRTRVFTSRIKTPQTTPAPTTAAKQKILPTPGPKLPVINKQPIVTHKPGREELSRPVFTPFAEAPMAPKGHPEGLGEVTIASVPVYQGKLEYHEDHPKEIPPPELKTQTEPNSKHLQHPPQPTAKLLQITPKPLDESMSQPHTTSPRDFLTKLEPQVTIQPVQQTDLISQPNKEPNVQSVPWTTPMIRSEPKPRPSVKTKPQNEQLIQLQTKTQTNLQAQLQTTTLPLLVTHHETTQSAPLSVQHEEPAPTEVRPERPPHTQTPSPHSPTTPQTQPQLIQPTQKPKAILHQSKATPQHQPKNLGKKHQKPTKKPRIKNQRGVANLQSRPQTQFPNKDPFQPKDLPKEHQPGFQTQPQTRTKTDHSKGSSRKTIHRAPSHPEEGKPLSGPGLATEKAGSYNLGSGSTRSSTAEVPHSPISSSVPTGGRNATVIRNRDPSHSSNPGVRSFSPSKTATSSRTSNTPGAANGAHHRGNALPKPDAWSREKPVQRPPVPGNKRPNLVGKTSDHDKPMDLKQRDKESTLKSFLPVTPKPKPKHQQQQTTTVVPVVNSSRYDLNENSSIFSSMPASEVDIMGKKRFIAPHVIYKTDKKPDEPCSITSSMAYFPDEEGSDVNVTGPPRTPPSNLTVVTVEGCPSFVILDWEKSDNETREYEVVSTTTGPNGQEVSILTTNQTHTAVENLTPDSSYEFTVTPKNELGVGPSSDPVTFNTESADPRVSEQASGKDAIWTQFPFKSDAYSECNGKQYIKRTWYRKFVGIQLCNSLRYKIYLSDSLNGKFYNIGDQTGYGEDHCQFVDSFLDGRTGTQMLADQLPTRQGFFRALRQEPVSFGQIGGKSHVTYVGWYECGTPIPGKW